VHRWEHQDVVDRHRARMAQAGAMMRRRAALAEHPFGTLKCRAGYRHFLVRGFDKVRGEFSLMALAYNFTRVLNSLGFEGFLARVAGFVADLPLRHQPNAIVSLLQLLWRLLVRIAVETVPEPAKTRLPAAHLA
jgi:hypothetical protein